MAHRHLPSPDLHRQDGQPYGLHPKETKKGRKKGQAEQAPIIAIFASSFVFFGSVLLVSFGPSH
jgi:hypothetical protein